jgi:hypothetical protein
VSTSHARAQFPRWFLLAGTRECEAAACSTTERYYYPTAPTIRRRLSAKQSSFQALRFSSMLGIAVRSLMAESQDCGPPKYGLPVRC